MDSLTQGSIPAGSTGGARLWPAASDPLLTRSVVTGQPQGSLDSANVRPDRVDGLDAVHGP